MDERTDDPILERMRRATLLDMTPGRLQDPEVGPQVGVITYSVGTEIERLLAFPLADVRKLVVHGLIVLATFDDDKAEEIIRQHYPDVIRDSDIS